MGGTVYDYGDESQFGVVYKKEDMEELFKKRSFLLLYILLKKKNF